MTGTDKLVSFRVKELKQTCSHVGAVLLHLNMLHRNHESRTSKLCGWNAPRRLLTTKPQAVSQLNLAKAKMEKVTKNTLEFDPRHTNTRDDNMEQSLKQLSKLKMIFPHTG